MSKEQRRPFEEKALFERNNLKPGKYTSDGKDVAVLEQTEREANKKIEEMKDNISDEIKMAVKSGSKFISIFHQTSPYFINSLHKNKRI